MSPDRKETVNGKLVEEYYWAGEYVVYVDHRAANGSYDKIIENLRLNKPISMDAR